MSTRWERWKLKRAEYPPNWRAISQEAITRAGRRCENCDAIDRWFHPITGSIVFLQASHVDHNRQNCAPENLRALCQRCHLAYDARLHAQESYITRRAGRALGDLFA